MSYQKDGLISSLNRYSAAGFREMWGDFLQLYPHGCLCFGVYMEERCWGRWRGSWRADLGSRRLDWSLAVVIQKARLQCSTLSAFGFFFFFLMPFTSKEEAQAVIVGVDLCFEGCSSVWCGEEGGLVMSTGGRVWALNERWERTNETSFSQA